MVNVGNSSSWHGLNADRRLGRAGQLAYLAANALRNLQGAPLYDFGLRTRGFRDASVAAHWEELPEGISAARASSELFWMSLPWEAMERTAGPLHALDVGCGTGGYGVRLRRWSGNRLQSYLGLDHRVHDEWGRLAKEHDGFRFFPDAAENVGRHIPEEANLFISQSALEHVPGDLAYFRAVRDFVLARKRESFHIHLVPGPLALPLYLFHGIRQYPLAALSRISAVFSGAGPDRIAYRLGGWRCAKLHWRTVTWPHELRRGPDRRDGRYRDALRQAVEQDMRRPSFTPVFYALVLHAYPTAHIPWPQ